MTGSTQAATFPEIRAVDNWLSARIEQWKNQDRRVAANHPGRPTLANIRQLLTLAV